MVIDSIKYSPNFEMTAFKICFFWKYIIVIWFTFWTRSNIQISWQEKGKSSFCFTSSKPYRLFIRIHMLFTSSLPSVYYWVILVLKCKQKVCSIAEKLIGIMPCFCAKSSKFISKLILNYYNSIIVISTSLEECDKTTAIYI